MRMGARLIRGAVGMGVTWAAVWSVAGALPRWVFGVETDAPLPIVFGVLGFLAGVVFAAVLAVTDGRRRFEQMSLARFAMWGAAGGLLLAAVIAKTASLPWAELIALAPTLAVASAACASGSLALAKRATRRDLPPDAGAAELRSRDNEKLFDEG